MQRERPKSRSTVIVRLTAISLLILGMLAMGKPVDAKASKSGGWSISKASYSFVTKGQKKIFKKAVNGLTGVSYKPVALLAEQTVAGTNYVYLCQGTTTSAKASKAWYILTASKDLKKKVSLRSVKKINIASIKTSENPRTKTTAGGLVIKSVKNQPKALPKDARKAFKDAVKTYTGYELRPIALVGTQVVAGSNYRIICYGKNAKTKDLFVVTVYKDLSGKSSIASCKPLKLEMYVD